MGNGRDGIENASVSAFHNVNLCLDWACHCSGLPSFRPGLPLFRLGFGAGLAVVQTGLCHRACQENMSATGFRVQVLLFLYKTVLHLMYLYYK